jgi:DUF2934 family protein
MKEIGQTAANRRHQFMNAAAKTPNPWPTLPADRHEAIRRRAEEIYLRNGKIPGHDLENWAQAEQEILRESPRRTAIVIRVDGAEYVGEYRAISSDGYRPGEFGPGAAVPVRFEADKMFVKRPNGKILETTIVKKID